MYFVIQAVLFCQHDRLRLIIVQYTCLMQNETCKVLVFEVSYFNHFSWDLYSNNSRF